MENRILGPREKALQINLNSNIYGTFAEIGAGQEVARRFFQAGGASGTIAKTISAYDMAYSDAIYGDETSRYVSEERLLKMLSVEFSALTDVMCNVDRKNTCYFTFADTAAMINYRKDNYCHAWMGMRFQLKPNEPAESVVLHIKLLDKDQYLQQRTLGIIGLNLVYACYFYFEDPKQFIESLLDSLSTDNAEINMIRFEGPQLGKYDNRILALMLVEYGMTPMTMFDRNMEVRQPSDMLYKKNVMILRGSFRPITYVGLDMLKSGISSFKSDVDYSKENTHVFCELTLDNLMSEGKFDEQDYLDRVNILCEIGQNVMITNFKEHHRLTSYLSGFKTASIGLIVGVLTWKEILNDKYYQDLPGGILEAIAGIFLRNLKMYVYPAKPAVGEELLTTQNISIGEDTKQLVAYLHKTGKMEDLSNINQNKLDVFSEDILSMIKNKQTGWEALLPKSIARLIKEKNMFGYQP